MLSVVHHLNWTCRQSKQNMHVFLCSTAEEEEEEEEEKRHRRNESWEKHEEKQTKGAHWKNKGIKMISLENHCD